MAFVIDYSGPSQIAATAAHHHPCTLTITAPDGLPSGAQVRIAVPFRAALDAECYDQIHLLDVRSTARVEVTQRPPATVHGVFGCLLPGARVVACGFELPDGCPAGTTIDIELAIKPSPHTGIDIRLETEVRTGAEFEAAGAPVVIANVAGPATRLECRVTAGVLSVFTTDEFANVAPFAGRVALDGSVHGLPAEVELVDGHAIVRGLTTGESVVRIHARELTTGWEATSPALMPGRPFFGELHFHTSFSADGGGDMAAAYTYARDVLCHELISVTDHTPLAHWEETAKLNEVFDEPGRFVAMPAWEWSTKHGHANVYLRTPDVDAAPNRAADATHPYHLQWPEHTFIVPHHTNINSSYDSPNRDGEVHWHQYDWSVRNDAIRLVEVAQCRGNFEADVLDDAWGIITEGMGASVQDALDMGYRIGFVGGTDNHSASPSRHPLRPGEYIGLTGIYADELTRDSLWTALYNRRTYATSGVPIVGWVRINGADTGTEITSVSTDVTLDGDFHGTAPIERIELIGGRRVIWSATPHELDVEVRDVVVPRSDSDWYYVRLRQTDGHRAWFSPVWIN